jgi:malonyl-CoA/methylmalonyl-CoA synthetase
MPARTVAQPGAVPMSTDSGPYDWLVDHARGAPDRALIQTADGKQLSYAGMAQLVERIGAAIANVGVRRGDRVCAQIDKSPEGVALYLACLRQRAVFVPLNTAYTPAELEYFLGDAEPKLAVVRPESLARTREIAARTKVGAVETLAADGTGSLTDLSRAAAEVTAASGSPGDLAALLYTSGTTGRSKGAMLTHRNLSSNASTLSAAWRFTSADTLLHALPIFHVHGLFVAVNTILACGGALLFLPKFDADEVMRQLPRATVMMGVPTFYTRLLQHPGLSREATGHMRLFVSGSAPLLAETHREFATRTGQAILERYGMSETLMNTSNPYDGARTPGSVGPPLPEIEVRITDADSGAVLAAADAIGMIEVRGPNVFSGYWRMPGKTAAEFRSGGWFVTGDLGRIDASGYVHIVGRGKDLVISGGYNVYPIEVESEIDALPGVVESAVIGVAHEDFGEAVTAVVVRKPGVRLEESAVRAALQQRLANYKLPKRVLFVDDLPRNTMGKVQKNVLRETYRDLYLAGSPPQNGPRENH